MTSFKDIRQNLLPRFAQSDVAKRTGLTAAAVSHIETGRRDPVFRNVRRLRDFYKSIIPGWNDSWIFDGPIDTASGVAVVDQFSLSASPSPSDLVAEDRSSVDEFAGVQKAFAGKANG